MTCHTLLAVKLPPAQHTFFIFCQRTDSLQSCCVTGLTNTELLFFVNVAILFSPVVSRFSVSLGLLFSANVRLLFSPVVSRVAHLSCFVEHACVNFYFLPTYGFCSVPLCHWSILVMISKLAMYRFVALIFSKSTH